MRQTRQGELATSRWPSQKDPSWGPLALRAPDVWWHAGDVEAVGVPGCSSTITPDREGMDRVPDDRLKQNAEPSVAAPIEERGLADQLALKDRALDVTAAGVTIADARGHPAPVLVLVPRAGPPVPLQGGGHDGRPGRPAGPSRRRPRSEGPTARRLPAAPRATCC